MEIQEALAAGPRTSKELQALTGWSQGKVSNVVRSDDQIVQLSGRRPHKYAATRPAFGGDDRLVIATVNSHGKNNPRAVLHPLRPDGYQLKGLQDTSGLLAGYSKAGLYDGLPYFMDDARPQGFLGKLIAQQLSEQADGFTTDPDTWSEEQVGRYLVSNGDDLPGDFVFGFAMMNRLRSRPVVRSREEYPSIAESTLEGATGVSSAGGEQQKFTAYISDIESHVIVKFTPAYDDVTSRRWRDILVTEFHALSVLADFEYPTAGTKLFEQNGRYFLESKRFDRRGLFGRSSMFSLRIVDAEFTGIGGSWLEVYDGLFSENLVTYFDLQRVAELQLFGRLIYNTDMHLGNLSVAIDGDTFSLLPVYDMCSMGLAPRGTEVMQLDFPVPELPEIVENTFEARIVNAAADFWKRVEQDPLSSDELREFIRTRKIPKVLEQLIVRKS